LLKQDGGALPAFHQIHLADVAIAKR